MKICVVGAGIMGWNHIRVLKSLGHDVLAVEQKDDRALEVRNTFGIEVYPDIEHASKADQPEAYVVVTPTTTHYEYAKWILENDPKPMLIEKPVCATIEEAEEIRELANKTKTMVMVGHIERYNPIVTHTKNFLNLPLSPKPPKLINSYRLGFNNRITDVGVVADLAIHDVDILSHLAGAKVVEVSAQHLINPQTGHECYGKLLLTFENGVVGSSEVSWVHPEKIRKIEIVSSDDQYIQSDYLTQTLTWSSARTGTNSKCERLSGSEQLKRIESLKVEHEDFINSIENGTDPLVTLDQGIEALKVIEASYKSVETGKVVKL